MTTTSMPVTTPISLLTKTGCVDKHLQLLMRGLLRLHRPHRGRDDDRVCLNLRFQNSRQHETLNPRESRFQSPTLASLDHFLHLENNAPKHAYTESLTDIQRALRSVYESTIYACMRSSEIYYSTTTTTTTNVCIMCRGSLKATK